MHNALAHALNTAAHRAPGIRTRNIPAGNLPRDLARDLTDPAGLSTQGRNEATGLVPVLVA